MLKMIVSFTGSQEGMTQRQKLLVKYYLSNLKPSEFHHGDCVGADAEAHDIAHSLDIPIHIHPPTNPDKRAWKENEAVKYPQKPYLKRNEDMARICDVLIATPPTCQEIIRSGTWATIRYARKFGKELLIVLPNGQEQ